MVKNYNVIKQSKNDQELLEVIKAENIIEAQKAAVKKYMNIALSTQFQLVVKQA